MLADRQVALIGGGHIAEIIIHRLTQGKVLSGARIIVSTPAPSRREHLSDRFGITPAVDNVIRRLEIEMPSPSITIISAWATLS